GELTSGKALEHEKKEDGLWDRANMLLMVPIARHSHAVYLRRMTEFVETARLPFPEQAERFEVLRTEPEDRSAALAWPFLRAMSKMGEPTQRKQARLRCAIAAVAAERYRRVHGHWPVSLSALVPDQLAEVSADPYDGARLRSGRLRDGVVFSPRGPDGGDNEGTLARERPIPPAPARGFRLWAVARRRQPPFPKPPADLPRQDE